MINIVLTNLMMVIFLYRFLEKVLSSKRIFGLEVCLFVLLEVSSYFQIIEWRYVVVVIGIVGYALLKYKDAIGYKLLMSCVFVVCLVISEVVCASLMHSILGINAADYRLIEYTLLLICVYLLLYVMLFSVVKWMNLYKRKHLPEYTWLLGILPVTSILFLLNLKEYFSLFRQDVLLISSLFGVLFANVIIFYLYFKVLDRYALEKQVNHLENQYLAMSTLYGSSASFLHEVTHRLFHMKSMPVNEIKNEIDDLCGYLLQQFRSTQTSCMVLQRVIQENYKKLVEKNILVKVDMDYVEFQQDNLFSLLMDMGIRLCENVEGNRFIHFKSRCINDRVVLCMECSGVLLSDDVNEICGCKVFYEQKNKIAKVTLVFEGDSI